MNQDINIYITHSYLKDELTEYLLNKNSFLSDIKIFTLEQYLEKYVYNKNIYDDDLSARIKAFFLIKSLEKDLNYFNKSANSLEFSDSCLKFYLDLLRQNYDFDNFNATSENTKDIKLIIDKISVLKLKEQALLSLLEQNINFPPAIIYNYAPQNKLEELLIEKLNFIKIDTYIKPDSYKLYHAKNYFEEIEWIIQDIIKNNFNLNDVTITLADQNYINALRLITNRYNINCNFTFNIKNNDHLINFIRNLIKIRQNGYELDLVRNLLNFKYLNIENAKEIFHYLDLININKLDFYHPFVYLQEVNSYDINYLKKYEVAAEIARCKIIENFDDFITTKFNSFQDYLSALYQIIISFDLDEQDILTANKINQLFSKLGSNEINECFNEILLHFISELKTTNYDKYLNAIKITDIDHPLTNKINYVCGLKQGNFSSFFPYNTLINEFYLEEIKFEALNIRYNRKLNLNLQSLNGNIVKLSYPCSDFQGKGFEVAFEIEKIVGSKSDSCLLKINNNQDTFFYAKLDQEISEKLFFDDDTLYGSISQFEKYFNCPFSYFLNKGLNLKQKDDFSFDNRFTGILIHYILENLILKYNKHYYEASLAEIKKIAEKKYYEYQPFFNHKNNKYEYFLDYICNNFYRLLQIYRDIELTSSYMPYKVEDKFEELEFDFDDRKVKIKGFVDRIDTLNFDNKTYFRILDYKTYSYDLNLIKFINGIQLQLITYLVAIKNKYCEFQPLGLYYLNFSFTKFEDSPSDRLQFEEKISKDFYSPYVLKGVTLTNIEELMIESDHEIQYTKNLKKLKNGIKNSLDLNYDYLKQALNLIYQELTIKLKQGLISIDPLEEGCLFCDYKAICRHNSSFRSLKKFYDDKHKELGGEDLILEFIKSGGLNGNNKI